MVLPTKTLGSYHLGELIAVGGMARTYRAWRDGEPDYLLCIKLLHNELVENIEFIQMFIDEASIAQSLKHPNIVRVYELGRSGEDHFIVMELVEGKDLKQISERSLRRGTRMTPLMVATVIHDVSRALAYVHSKTGDDGSPLGIIHRDVSPHNIMIAFEGARVKLTDFGIAKAASRLTRTRTGAVKGKYGYMSPEQAQGKTLDGRSDLFAIGIIMHELLTGQRLFSAETSFEAFAMVLEQPIPAPSSLVPGIDQELDRICLKALERDLSRRYASCAELTGDLQRWLEAHVPSREATGLSAFLKTLFDLERGQLPQAKVIHDPKLIHMADLGTQVIPASPPLTRSQPLTPIRHDSKTDGTLPAVWLQEQEDAIAEALPTSAPEQPESALEFSSATHTDIFNPLSHLHEPTDHGFLEEAYQTPEEPNLDEDIGEPTIPIDVPAMLGVEIHDPYASAPHPKPANPRPRISPHLSASAPAVPRPAAPQQPPSRRSAPPRTPSVATPSLKRPTTPQAGQQAPTQRPIPRQSTPTPPHQAPTLRASAPLLIALAGVFLLAVALVLGVAMLIVTSQRADKDANAHQTGSDVVVAERVTDDSATDEKDPQPKNDTPAPTVDNTTPSDDSPPEDTTAKVAEPPPEEDQERPSEPVNEDPDEREDDQEPPLEDSDLAAEKDDTAPTLEDNPVGSIDASAGSQDSAEGDDEARAAALKRKQKEAWRERATITINAAPWADVSVNGRAVGRTPKRLRLRAGTYTILLQNPELQRAVRKQLKVSKGETRSINHVFK